MTYTGPTAINDVQILLNIPYSPNMQNDFSDLRFTYYDGVTENEIPFWIENRANGVSSEVWVRVPLLSNTGITRLYVYYGNKTPIINASNGKETFFLFDDFEGTSINTSLWTTDTGFSPFISNSELRTNQGVGAAALLSFDMAQGYVSETKVKINATGASYSGTFANPMSSTFTAGGNTNADATILYMTASGTSNLVNHWTGDGCATGYNIHISTISSLTTGVYTIMSTEVQNNEIIFYNNRVAIHNDPGITWCKQLNYIRIGFFATITPLAGYSRETIYDWVLVRKAYQTAALSQTIGNEESGDYVFVDILNPTNGAFVSSPVNIQFNVSSANITDIYLFVDGTLVNTWFGIANTTQSYSLSLTSGTHSIQIIANNSAESDSESISFVVLSTPPPSSGGGDNICISCIAEEVWKYENRTLTYYPEINYTEVLNGIDRLKEELYAINAQINESDVRKQIMDLEKKLDEIERSLVYLNYSEDLEELNRINKRIYEVKNDLRKLDQKLEEYKPEEPGPVEFPDWFYLVIGIVIFINIVVFYFIYRICKRVCK